MFRPARRTGHLPGAMPCHPTAPRPAHPARTLTLALAVLALLAVAGWSPRPGGPGPAAAWPAQATATPEPTYEPWTPAGVWRALHAPYHDPLWRNDPPRLRGVHGVTQADGRWLGWAVGEEGAMARFDGTAWHVDETFSPRRTSPRTYHFHDVFAAAADDVWLVGWVAGDRRCVDCGTMLHFDGTAWEELDRYTFRVNGRMGALNAIDMLKAPDGEWYGWVVGDDAPFDSFKAIILGLRPETGWRIWQTHNIAQNLYDVRLVSPSEAWAVGEGGVESRYNEDGAEGYWPPLGRSGSDTLYAVDLTEPMHGWDGGAGGRMNKYRGHCHDTDTNTTCWFQNEARPVVNQAGSMWPITIRAIDLLTRSQGWLVGDVSARITTVAYQSGSKEWQMVDVEDDPGRPLYGLYVIDDAHGFAVGDAGVILGYAPPDAPPPSLTPSAAPRSPTLTPTATRRPSTPDAWTPTTVPSPSPTVAASATTIPSPSPTASPLPPSQTAVPSPSATPVAPTATATEPPPRWRVYLAVLIKRR